LHAARGRADRGQLTDPPPACNTGARTFASPDYIRQFGMPDSVDALESDGHRMVGFFAPDAPEIAPLNFTVDGQSRQLLIST
jgi:hypothetical protein